MSPSAAHAKYSELLQLVRQRNLLGSTASVLGWDQETMMPAGGLEHRSNQLAQLAGMCHQMMVDPTIGELLSACEADPNLTADPASPSAVNLREIRREYILATKLPQSLVEELARTATVSRSQWVEARKANDYARFEPWLTRIIELTRRKAECFGWPPEGEAWDAVADLFEPGMTARSVAAVFTPLRQQLIDLVGRVVATGKKPVSPLTKLKFPVDQQAAFVRQVAEAIGFDFHRGRLDISAHPFSSGFHPTDVRLTTRYDPADVGEALYGVLHEAGHGIYDQGLPVEHAGTPRGDAVSLAIHESQSRTWENLIGRSEAFWRWCLPRLKAAVKGAGRLTSRAVWAGVNVVQPSLIRTEADEATYNLHIMIRFELERPLMSGDLAAKDLPEAWNARYKEYLGIDVPNDAQGCMQDIHWSQGAIGYFPTYALGNLYAAQFFEQARAEMSDLDEQIAAGSFAPFRGWLNRKIHCLGMTYRSADLCRHVTGRELSADPLLRYLEQKLSRLYPI